MIAKEVFEHESVQDSQTISRFLKELMTGFEKKNIVFESEEQQMVLHPDNLLEFGIKVKKKKDKNKITLKFFWKDSGQGAVSEADLSIGSESSGIQ
ncbi:MAG: amphi-Trp domain-containing protein [Desulfobacterales bacterium]